MALLFNTVTLPASVGVVLRCVSRHVASSVKSVWRAHTSPALRWPASETVFGVLSFPATDTVTSETPGGKFAGARTGFPAPAFGKVAKVRFYIGIPRHLTIRSSRPRVVASAMCFTLRLHMSAAPPQGGLTQALGRLENFADEFC